VQALGARSLKPIMGPEVIVGGAKVVYDCVGNSGSVEQALRFSATGGTIVMIGLAKDLDGVDWTPLWMNELRAIGTFTYGVEEWGGRSVSTMQLALDLMAEGKVDLAPLVTHRFTLDDYRTALETVTSKGSSGVIKATFDFRDGEDRSSSPVQDIGT
ncbi:MAG: zinc-binding dehydrogenase, partial [Chloroflexota bacterium]